jgi:Signal transduction histidine kinase regulating C4-dicarboxylate transport system
MLLLQRIKTPIFASSKSVWWKGAIIACVSVALSVALRTALESFGRFYYLPMVPAVMITAMLANRFAAALSILLSIACNLALVERVSGVDALINAALFATVGWSIAEVCRRLIDALSRAHDLAHSLRVRGALLDTIMASTPVITLDDAGAVRRITPAAADILGRPRDAILDRPLAEFIDGADMAALSGPDASGVLKPPPCGRWLARPPNEAARSLTLHAGVLPAEVAPEHLVLTLVDQSRAEAAQDRARDLEGQLSQVWRLNSLGEMAATLAHELNQPLTAATVYLHAGQADIVRAGGPLSDSAGRALDLAKTQLLRAGDIIRRMRDQIASGDRTFAEERVSTLIDDLAPVFTLISRDVDVPIRIDVHDAEDTVMADRIQVQQAVANLVRNAVDAVTARPGGLVSVVGRSLGPEGYEISVEDNGPGIAAEDMDRVFRPLQTTKAGGMGLGLSVTRSIVESHGAQLVVGRSGLGGAAFSFRLPRFTEVEAA